MWLSCSREAGQPLAVASLGGYAVVVVAFYAAGVSANAREQGVESTRRARDVVVRDVPNASARITVR
jgi:hypothetical protein